MSQPPHQQQSPYSMPGGTYPGSYAGARPPAPGYGAPPPTAPPGGVSSGGGYGAPPPPPPNYGMAPPPGGQQQPPTVGGSSSYTSGPPGPLVGRSVPFYSMPGQQHPPPGPPSGGPPSFSSPYGGPPPPQQSYGAPPVGPPSSSSAMAPPPPRAPYSPAPPATSSYPGAAVGGPPSSSSYGQPPAPSSSYGGPPPPPSAGVGSAGGLGGGPPGGYGAPQSAPMSAPPRAVPFYSMPGSSSTGAAPGGGGGMPPPPPSAPGSGYASGGGMMPPPPTTAASSLGGPPPPPPPPGGGGVAQLSQQFGAMGIRPPPISGQAGQGVGPPELQSPPVYPGTFPGMRNAQSQLLEAQGGPGSLDGSQLPQLSEVDLSVQCDPRYMRFTVTRIPNSQNNAQATKLPLGVIIQPMALDAKGEESIDVINFGSTGIVRCKKCRTYINPFVSWLDNGRRWRCNVCGTVNDVPSSYFQHLDANGQRRDKSQRPELCKGSVELVAPGEYMVRPPQAPVYVFVIDVSYAAVASGMLAQAVSTIRRALDELPGDPRTQVGLVTFDSTVHFYNLKPSLKQPQVLVVPDIMELFVPLPDDLLVNLKDSRPVVDQLLDSLLPMFQNTRNIENALGPALTAAYRVMGHIGGKMCVLTANLPTLGEGRLKHREDLRALGTEREHTLLNAEDTFYRTKAVEFSRVQISVDLFLFSSTYTDVATLSTLPKYTGGNLFYYPGYTSERDGGRFDEDLYSLLTRPTGFEAVMRVRVTRGLKVVQFHGSYYIRGTDLLALPNCSTESVFAVELAHEEAFLTASVICVQTALLHTTSSGERRIRVHTLAAPVSQIIQDIIASVDVEALTNLLAKRSLDVAIKTGLDLARTRLQQQCADILRSCRGYAPSAPGMPAALPPSLELLPLYCMALAKNVAFRGGNDVRPDLRSYMMQLLSVMNVRTSTVFVYPRMFALHDMGPDVGKPMPSSNNNNDAELPPPHVVVAGRNQVRLGPAVNLSVEALHPEGLYLLENGVGIWIWVGRRADPAKLSALFGLSSLEGIDPATITLRLEGGSDLSARVSNMISALREERSMRALGVTVVVEGDPQAAPFYWHMVEDRAPFHGGSHNYAEYVNLIGRQSYGPGMGPS